MKNTKGRKRRIPPISGIILTLTIVGSVSVNDKINLKRVEGIVQSVPKYFPDIQLAMPGKKDIWFGFRPCSPDGLPYIGYSKKINNMIIAGGHAMSGLSLGPASGKLVAELANRQPVSVNVEAFGPDRFS